MTTGNLASRKTRSIRVVVAALALAVASFAVTPAFADGDPLEPLAKPLSHQDELAGKGLFDQVISEAEARAKDGTPQSLYLLGRALGNTAIVRRVQNNEAEFQALMDRARKAFGQALEADALIYAPALLGLARCDRFSGNLENAISLLERALKIAPSFKAAGVELAQVYAEKGRHAEADLVLNRLIEQRPKDADLRIVLGSLKLARRRYEEGEREFRAVLADEPENAAARKSLAASLMYQEHLKEAAVEFEKYRLAVPEDDEPYRALFMIYRRANDRVKACHILEDLKRAQPGTEAGVWAGRVLEQVSKDEAWTGGDPDSPAALATRLKERDPKVLADTLTTMRRFNWPALPLGVYDLLAPAAAPADVRKLAVELIGLQKDARTLTLIEVVLFHPKERDPDLSVRQAAAAAIASVPSPAILPLLYKALDDSDREIRESAVRGLTAITLKSFRVAGTDAPDGDAWNAERQQWAAWWRGDGTLAKRDALDAFTKLFGPIKQGRRRLSEYAVICLDDGNERTWRVAYDLFRSLSGQDFGFATGDVAAADRAIVAQQAREWFARDGSREAQ